MPTDFHQEVHFEDALCRDLAQEGWLYEAPLTNQGSNSQGYDAALALYPADLAAWVQESQPDLWQHFKTMKGLENNEAEAVRVLGAHVRKALDHYGVSDVLHKGVRIIGLPRPLKLCQFKPALSLNADLLKLYHANKLRVLRQVYYQQPLAGQKSQNSIDVVLCLNGVPVVTMELKSDFTQSAQQAISQYRQDRLPKAPRRPAEPLLSVPGGAVVHFAVSQSEVAMCTALNGAQSVFLPFNQGNQGGAGNPAPKDGYGTAYLWQQVLTPDSLLEILDRFLKPAKTNKGVIKGWIFPRYHQLMAVRSVVEDVRQKGAGQRYLIQHSAGSGKTKSIAWVAHALADLHNDQNQKLFDSVVVVSDRKVLDGQLADEISDFESVRGMVATVSGAGGSKSEELAQALTQKKNIIVCTIQTFPFVLKKLAELSTQHGQRFAVIADEAHSSQTGQAAQQLKKVLSGPRVGDEIITPDDSEEDILTDILSQDMSQRAAQAPGISYLAFTATPKAKTLELFGTKPNPTQPVSEDNKPAPFHIYPMRQAIEEGFILNVLDNWVSYGQAFKLALSEDDAGQREVDSSKATHSMLNWVRLNPKTIETKAQIILDHYTTVVQNLLSGQARAMVVTRSRPEAVLWTLALRKEAKARQLMVDNGQGGQGPLAVLGAFSGEVHSPTHGIAEPLTEAALNQQELQGQDIREAFGKGCNRILVVANKFQTGFDEPLLCSMYVDRPLSGIQAVQTLSRLNRCYSGPYGTKEQTYVVDFTNKPETILEAFQTYFEHAELAEPSKPEMVMELAHKLESSGYFNDQQLDDFVKVIYKPNVTPKNVDKVLRPLVDPLLQAHRQAQQALNAYALAGQDNSAAADRQRTVIKQLEDFRRNLGTYYRAYNFLSQLWNYQDTSYEKLALLARFLPPLLKFERDQEVLDLSELELTHLHIKSRGKQALILQPSQGEGLSGLREAGLGGQHEADKKSLEVILQQLNQLYGTECSNEHQLGFIQEATKAMMQNATLRDQALHNSRDSFMQSLDLQKSLTQALMDLRKSGESYQKMSTATLMDASIKEKLISMLVQDGQLWDKLRINP
ncbi:type I restriction endonuclease subunit R [Formicincola oecophyllae]|uniref:Type I restriction endonuclease subunit R n=1 Tax=Formicincola oecophyllae TaxID=2558361 RepID=A0A4Y6UA56_9PROT|nr:DEAD/DEAH box helicase family protein [Formicincola oecophyllae]QDH13035.1 type I restriction endonuclease subunit R [Formicincola oecophyllae]